MKFWNFKNETSSDNIELRIDGDIIDDDNVWIYEWFGMQAAAPNTFRNELTQHAGKNISVWIDSYGGSVFAATGIYNALMEHKKTGAKVTTIIDGKAMSAAATVFTAGDVRKITIGGIFMVHNPLTSTCGYAVDLRKAADVLDVVKESIINAYQSATGLSREKISLMMDNETYMNAQMAVKDNFATEILYDNQNTNKDDIMNFSFNRLSIQNAADDSMKKFFEIAKNFTSQENPVVTDLNKPKTKEEDKVEIKNVEDLKKAHPELINQAIADGIKNERTRITALEALNDPQNAAVVEIINDAKANGKTAAEVEAIVNIVKKHAPAATDLKNAQNQFKNVLIDNKNSGVDGVVATGGSTEIDEKQQDAATVNFMVGFINKKNGGKK